MVTLIELHIADQHVSEAAAPESLRQSDPKVELTDSSGVAVLMRCLITHHSEPHLINVFVYLRRGMLFITSALQLRTIMSSFKRQLSSFHLSRQSFSIQYSFPLGLLRILIRGYEVGEGASYWRPLHMQ